MKKIITAALLLSFSLLSSANENIEANELEILDAKENKEVLKAGGMQYFVNKTNKKITIKIGDFFPSSYTLNPRSDKWIYVSTDRQTIRIVEVEN